MQIEWKNCVKLGLLMSIITKWINFYLSFINYDNIKLHTINGYSFIHDLYKKCCNVLLNRRELWQNLPSINLALGKEHFFKGELKDAVLRFKIVLFLCTKLSSYFNSVKVDEVYYYLGRAHYQLLNKFKAKEFLLRYVSSNEELFKQDAQYCINCIDNNFEGFDGIPLNIVKSNFDQIYSNTKYVSDQAAQTALFAMLNEAVQFFNMPYGNTILDLGCGIGYFADLCREQKLASQLIGVDISSVAANHAKMRKKDGIASYSAVYNTSIQDYIASIRDDNFIKADIIVLSDVIGYIYDIPSLFANIVTVMAEKGLLILSFKLTENAETEAEFDQYLENFLFSEQYIINMASQEKFNIIVRRDVVFSNGQNGKLMLFSFDASKE